MMDARAQLLRDDWQTKAQVEHIQLELLQLVDFVNRFHASAKSRLVALNEKMTAMERNLRYVEMAVRSSRAAPVTSSSLQP
ncbi:hypothetical protein Gpo141_00003294 [Globisporangium polare]